MQGQITQVEEIIVDIEKQLAPKQQSSIDTEQLEWLKCKLIESWNHREVRGRVIFLHHPPYVTEATKWQQAQTLAIRHHLRKVFDAVAETIGSLNQNRPLVDLVFSGHAHCLEYLQTQNTGHGDSRINWIVCGGSGFSLRRQRLEGADLIETFGNESRLVANSKLFIGRSGQGSQKRRPYSCLRIDVKAGDIPQFVVRPFVSEWYQRQWHNQEIKPFVIGGSAQ